MNKDEVRFSVAGPGVIVGEESGFASPRKTEWGTAPVLIRSGLQPGKITVYAEVSLKGSQMPVAGEITLKSVSPGFRMLYDQQEAQKMGVAGGKIVLAEKKDRQLEKEIQRL